MYDEQDVNVEEEETEQEEHTEETETAGEEQVYRSQEDVDNAIKNRLKRFEKKIAKDLGSGLDEAKELIAAGRAVTQASGLSPAQIRERLAAQRQQHGYGTQGYRSQGQEATPPQSAPNDDVRQEINEIKNLISEEREEKVKKIQEDEARKEFGELFDSHADDIYEKAEDTGLSLADAAAVVLRPKLREHLEERTKAEMRTKRSRKLDDSSAGPEKHVDVNSVLSPDQKRVATRMGIGYKKYYEQLKELGQV